VRNGSGGQLLYYTSLDGTTGQSRSALVIVGEEFFGIFPAWGRSSRKLRGLRPTQPLELQRYLPAMLLFPAGIRRMQERGALLQRGRHA
jgi:hypothetical protein